MKCGQVNSTAKGCSSLRNYLVNCNNALSLSKESVQYVIFKTLEYQNIQEKKKHDPKVIYTNYMKSIRFH